YDEDGAWAASGAVHRPLLGELLDEPYFRQPAPKSTGRDLFHEPWLNAKLARFGDVAPADVQATLTQLTAVTIARAIVEEGVA
ncbi:anhydro-N-acetylmuramic acid kinase, partial [Acinetobacter baumannii]|nr:anhydro-N-acetylmuramic acid kinase [Acinetobacter baumannii]